MEPLTNIFRYGSKELRTTLIAGDPWFIAKDVCKILQLTDVSKSVSRLDMDEKGTTIIPTLGGEQSLLTINESGLYSLILSSRKQEAKNFKRWVTHNVLPSIRKTGKYINTVSDHEKLVAAMNLSIETAEEMAEVKKFINEVRCMVEDQITIISGEQKRINKAIGQKVYELESDKVVRSHLFRAIHREIKDKFGVSSYRDIKRNDMQAALRYIDSWIPKRNYRIY